MSEVEKLRALLKEARHEIATWHLGSRDPLVQRIDAALAEPVQEESLYGIREDRDSLRIEIKRLERERNEARVLAGELMLENEKLRKLLSQSKDMASRYRIQRDAARAKTRVK